MNSFVCTKTKKKLEDHDVAYLPDNCIYDKTYIRNFVGKHGKSPVTFEKFEIDDIELEIPDHFSEKFLELQNDLVDSLDHLKNYEDFENIDFEFYIIEKINEFSYKFIYSVNDHIFKTENEYNSYMKYIENTLKMFIFKDNDEIYEAHCKDNVMILKKKSNFQVPLKISALKSFTKKKYMLNWTKNFDVNSLEDNNIFRNIFEGKNIKKNTYDFSKNAKYLNRNQVSFLKNFSNINLLSGPPGTGKTTVITEIAKNFIQKNELCIILSEKNKALSAISEKVTYQDFFKIASFGSNVRDENLKKFDFYEKIHNHPITFSQSKKLNDIQKTGKVLIKKIKKKLFNYFHYSILCNFSWENPFQITQSLPFLRMHPKKRDEINELLLKLNKKYSDYSKIYSTYDESYLRARDDCLKDVKIFITTLGSLPKVKKFIVNNLKSSSVNFVIDEASCCRKSVLLDIIKFSALTKINIKSLTVIGDQNQLGIYNLSDKYQKSLMDFMLENCKASSCLDIQYRFPDDITKFINKHFYIENPLKAYKKSEEKSFNVIESIGSKKDFNYNEANDIKNFIQENNIDIKKLLIITPYIHQRNIIKKIIPAGNIVTIDSSQGNQADIVIISMVRSPTKFLNKRRINVMLTRYIDKMYIFAEKEKMQKHSILTDLL